MINTKIKSEMYVFQQFPFQLPKKTGKHREVQKTVVKLTSCGLFLLSKQDYVLLKKDFEVVRLVFFWLASDKVKYKTL